MKKIVISAIGKDRPGIVAGLTETLFLAGCNLEDSAMTILESEFAVLLIASGPSKISMHAFQARLQAQAKKMGLFADVKAMEIARGRSKPSRCAIVTASGADQTGILCRLAGVLAKRRVNITDLTSRQIPGPGKTTLYVVMIEVALPEKLSLEDLRRDLGAVAKAMRLDVSVREISVEQL